MDTIARRSTTGADTKYAKLVDVSLAAVLVVLDVTLGIAAGEQGVARAVVTPTTDTTTPDNACPLNTACIYLGGKRLARPNIPLCNGNVA
jgi:hypothetical protein